jgi:hypothetical protein
LESPRDWLLPASPAEAAGCHAPAWSAVGGPLPRHRGRLVLESLEGRWVPSTVLNLNDAGAGSLRQAILDTPAGGTVDFQQGLNGTIMLTSGELLINKNLTISGPGAAVITVSGNQASRVFDIGAQLTVNISGLTIANGKVTTGNGGGIANSGTLTITNATVSGCSVPFSVQNAGGIDNFGTLTVTSSTLSGNTAGSGGGIDNFGTLTVTSSTLSGNSAQAAAGSGGGIDNLGTLTVTNSTLTGNTATATSRNGIGQGGGIQNASGMATVTSCTLSGNSATGTLGGNGGGLAESGGTVTSRNTIVAGNLASTSADVGGVLNSQGHNPIGDGTGGSGFDPTDQVGTASNPIDPMLGPLQDNGGPTFTRALLPGSPAIDAGDNTDAPMWDQRGPGFRRIVSGIIDIGAFEVQARGHGGPTHQPLPDPVPVQVLGTPAGPLFGQLPTLTADPSPGARSGFGTDGRGQSSPLTLPPRRCRYGSARGVSRAVGHR